MVTILKERGFSVAGEAPKLLTYDGVREADFVITMGCGETCPVFPGKTYEDWDVDDPKAKSSTSSAESSTRWRPECRTCWPGSPDAAATARPRRRAGRRAARRHAGVALGRGRVWWTAPSLNTARSSRPLSSAIDRRCWPGSSDTPGRWIYGHPLTFYCQPFSFSSTFFT